ncbi:uncharacterized protein LOC143282410 [Babylonia areolata]|uniref:uncharacterized protein LOC143282410 n=1 Tax=Babylonia areolata TaxID=304850 RepID=UPI003FD4376F
MEEDPLLLEDDLLELQELTHQTPYSPYSLHSLFPPHLQAPPHHPYLHHHLPGLRRKRFVVTHSMIEQGRLNMALLINFILAILCINLFFIIVILWSKTLRSSSKHLLIVSVAFADLIQGLFILPIITDLSNKPNADFDCTTFQVARLFADFLIPSITTLGVLALNLDYVLRLVCNAYSEGTSRAVIMCALFVTPWVLSCVLLVPIYVVGVQKVSLYNSFSTCHVVFVGGYARALLVLSYILYGFVLLVLTVVVAVMYLVKREQLGLDVTGERVHAPFDICLASFILVLFYTPIFLFTLLTTEGYLGCTGRDECRTLNWSYTLSLWLMFTKSWVMPMAWFFGRDTLKGIREVFTCC